MPSAHLCLCIINPPLHLYVSKLHVTCCSDCKSYNLYYVIQYDVLLFTQKLSVYMQTVTLIDQTKPTVTAVLSVKREAVCGN